MFGFLADIFNLLLYVPLFNILIALYSYLPGHDFGIAIIVLTILIRLLLYPTAVKALKSQRALQRLQPLMDEIQKKYKDDKEKQAKETLELYKKEKINPFSSLLLTLAQLPILIALYRVFWDGLKTTDFSIVYSFIARPTQIHTMFLGLVDLANPNIVFAFIAGALQFVQTKMLLPQKNPKKSGSDFSVIMQKQMTYIFPVLTVMILFRLPSALGLYWITSAILSIVQQYFILKEVKKSEASL